MNIRTSSMSWSILGPGVLTLLAACGGGDDDPPGSAAGGSSGSGASSGVGGTSAGSGGSAGSAGSAGSGGGGGAGADAGNAGSSGAGGSGGITMPPPGGPVEGIVFVSRSIPDRGSIYWDVVKDMPGVGAHSRFRVAAPGKLIVQSNAGERRVLIDGSNPSAASLNLIDVNAPDVSYDGKRIAFAGLPAGNHGRDPANNPGAWRIYEIGVDGSDLRQITKSDQNLDYAQFGPAAGGLQGYDDTDPVYLPDGRIALSSTRWPSYGHYSGVRTTNLYVVNTDGTNLHRITAERNGADRPIVDPMTGKIVYARWWRNHRFPVDSMDTVADSSGGYVQKDGLTMDRNDPVGGPSMFRNAWHAATINPDGTGLAQWGGTYREDEQNHVYGGTFTPEGDFVANFFPMYNMTEAAGFGGLRKYARGARGYQSLIGITSLTLDYVNAANPTSYGIFKGSYAGEPEALPDGKLIISWAADHQQDYGLYTINADGSGRALLYDNPGTTELRARAIRRRGLPPVIADTVTQVPSLLPPGANAPYDKDGTFTFAALNIYANAGVDEQVISAPAVGSTAKIRFFIDHQRTSPGSFPGKDWPIVLGEKPVHPDGSIDPELAPANVPLFEQLRSANNTVPLTGGHVRDGAGQVEGLNFGRPGAVARCVGCHAGHTMIPVPANDADALFSNLAPGATVTVSSTRDAKQNVGLIDRKVQLGEIWRYWASESGKATGQWAALTFPVPVTVRKVRLYNPRQGGEANSTIQVTGATVRLYSDAGGTQEVAHAAASGLAVSGTDVAFSDVKARVVRVEIGSVTGTFYGSKVASLAEIEVIARGEAP